MKISYNQNLINFSQSSQDKRDDNKNTDRVIAALITTGLGTSIGESLYRIDRADIQKSIKTTEQDKVEFQKTLSEAEKDSKIQQEEFKKALKDKTDILNSIDNITEKEVENTEFKTIMNRLNTGFYDQIARVNEGKQVIVPNCIMLTGENSELNNRLINYLGKKSNCHFVQIKHTENILDYLKKAEENYTKSSKRTLLYVDNFEQLINPATAPAHLTTDLKNLMGKSSEKYKTTIIFSTKDASKLDQIALQPHRIGEKIDVNIKDTDYEKIKPAMQKIENLSKKVKPAIQKAEELSKKIAPAVQKTDDLNEKIKPFTKKIEELNDKLKNLKRTKVLVGAVTGLLVGILGIEILRSMNQKESSTN